VNDSHARENSLFLLTKPSLRGSIRLNRGIHAVRQQVRNRRKALPAYFYPLLSREDLAAPERLTEYHGQLGSSQSQHASSLLYVHIPFCRDRCRFCGFYRKTIPDHEAPSMLTRYLDRLLAELQCWIDSGVFQDLQLDAVYIGGGTPSFLTPELISRLLRGLQRQLSLSPEVELSFEGEARTLADPDRLAVLRTLGVGRVSFGVQTFAQTVRQHAALGASLDDVYRCADAVRSHGYGLCLDLMYGLPGQTEDSFQRDLDIAVQELKAELVDLYELVLYPNSALFAERHRARELMPDQTQRMVMYGIALDYFAQVGFQQWTLEDFCRPGARYRMKQLTYGGDDGQAQVLALGACAVGYVGRHAYRNHNLESYLQTPAAQLPIALLRRASHTERRRRPLFFFPRRLSLEPRRLTLPLDAEDEQHLEAQIAAGYAKRRGGQILLTRKGKLVADELVSRFLTRAEQRKIFKLVQ
jgi:oxygen-independent coproporphyrinogen-3 oxidase